jgi:hypothetical protein
MGNNSSAALMSPPPAASINFVTSVIALNDKRGRFGQPLPVFKAIY